MLVAVLAGIGAFVSFVAAYVTRRADLVAQLDMPGDQLRQRLQELLAMATPPAPQAVEWAVADVAGVRVYVDGNANIIVTRQELTP